uniref:Protein kinase domain-containing protein n=1 Tax=Solanum lycopersicum TaxID=4081 RepID=A0A3Q7F7G3_SOLLC
MRLRNLLQMTTTIAIEDVRREVKILRALTGHRNLVQFYDAYEDEENVYIVMDHSLGLSDYVTPDERLNDIVRSALCVTVYAGSDS